jgi:ABC-type multidrug transport system ATPase subunit
MDEVGQLSDRAGVIVNGKLIATNTVHDLVSQYGGGIKVSVKGRKTKEAEKILQQFTENVVHDTDIITGKFKTREEASKALAQLYQMGDGYRIEIIEPNMDDVFAHLAGHRVDERGELI